MAKGSSFEREMCRNLSLWWTGNKDDDVFWRSSQSGGRATTRAKKGKRTRGQEGDISATAPVGVPFTRLFTVELKRGYNSYSPDQLLDYSPTMAQQGFEKFILQAVNACTAAGTQFWLIIHKRDKRRPMAYFPKALVYLAGVSEYHEYNYDTPKAEYVIKLKSGKIIGFVGMALQDFQRLFTPKTLTEISKHRKD